MLRAFSDKRYDYYELTTPLGYCENGSKKDYLIPDGAIFVHDRDDSIKGTIGDGCLKLCWTPDGNTYGWICGGGMAFHPSFKNSDLFKLVQPAENKITKKLVNLINDLENQLEKAKEQLEQLK